MALNVGDAVLTFLGDTSQLDQVFARLPAQTEAAMGAATGSVSQLGDAVGGVNFELDATAQNVPYCGEVIKEVMGESSKVTREARGEAGLLGEAFGIHLPRHVRSFLAEIPGVATVLSAAFSATAIFFLIEALAKGIEKIEEFAERGHKLQLADQVFNTEINNSFKSLDDKLLEAGAGIDNLRGDHLAALKKELELIDHQTLRDLVTEFDILAKASDAMFAQVKRSWLDFDAGSTGAKNALTDFKTQYDLLLAEGKGKEASDLLAGTLKSAKDTLQAMKDQNAETEKQAAAMRESNAQAGAAAAFYQLANSHKDNELKAQETLVRALAAQVDAEKKINDLKSLRTESKEIKEDNTEIKERERVLQANVKEEQRAINTEDKLREEQRNKAIANLQEQEKEKIAAVRAGSEAQLQAIEAAIKEEESKGLQDTAFYKSLQEQKVRFHAAALAAQEKSENLAAAKAIVSAENNAKVETAATTEAYSQQEHAVTNLGNFKIISAREVSHRLELLYAQENQKLLAILNDLLKKEQDAVQSAQAKLTAAQGNPLVSPQQIDELKKLLSQAEKAVADTQVKISKTTQEFQTRQLAADRGFYGQSLALAIATGQKIEAEKLKNIHTDLLLAQAELVEAKARHQNTLAIDKEIQELKKQEKEQESLIRGNSRVKQSMTELQSVSEIAFSGMADAFAIATDAMITRQRSFGQALIAATLDMLAEIAKHYEKIYIAKGIGNLADGNFGAAALDFAAAAAFAVVAGVLQGEASNIGSGGPNKGAAANQGGTTSIPQNAGTQAGAQPTTSVNVPHLASGALATSPSLVVVGDAPPPGEAIIPLGNRRVMESIGSALAEQLQKMGHSHGDIHVTIESDIPALVKKISSKVSKGQARLLSSNSNRVTRRSV